MRGDSRPVQIGEHPAGDHHQRAPLRQARPPGHRVEQHRVASIIRRRELIGSVHHRVDQGQIAERDPLEKVPEH